MKKWSIKLLSALSAIGILAMAGSTIAAEEYGPPDKVTTLLFQPCFDQSDAGWSLGIVPWAKAVEEATQGTVKFQLEPAGAITSGGEAFGATVAGMIDVYAGWATVYGGDMPEGMLAFGMAMGANNWRDAWAAMWGDPKYRIGELVQEAAKERNLRWVGWTSQGPNSMFTKFPVNKLEDLAGKKMRAGGPQGLFHEAVGGAPVSMGGGDIYTAIRLGTLDGTYWDTGGIDDMAFHEVIKYASLPGWCPAQHQEIYINLDKWNSLNQWQRDQIDSIFMPTYFETSRLHWEGVNEALEILKGAGGEVIQLSDEEVKRMRARSIEVVWPKVAERSERNAKGVALWKQYLEDIGEL
ncbi:TRAP transporter substrate-binding protein [Desulfofustis glycolicus]|uniref:TRAP-type C4-dicarboxylate transport system, substrate-binding protein n=1 Tax=Desulfofustis glycolicus DSM 9705 TaxID=1121409 RepID=A0A1M5SNV1_9BACT|nr:TRAP transporter substrate-binding protein DctP [Desulfofustis glycolicus]MCB2215616.1 TRAP transporter substrate-binding protein DctP [Desulfobulbaceae bacterium]SHH40174.1 TRAP-type C4-dicarboxylate transport system, substrate-binding protein [Desulfofustis glycolicus DSM 9705]